MWIPHTIPESTFDLFRPTAVVGTLPNDVGRAVASEDFGWADRAPATLRSLCVDNVAAHFARYRAADLFRRVTPANAAYLAETLDTGLPVRCAVHVPDGEYWRRRWADRAWPPLPPWDEAAAGSPKTRYLTRLVAETVENSAPGSVDETEGLAELLAACAPHVTVLHCGRLRGSERPPSPPPPPPDGPDPAAAGPAHVDMAQVLGLLYDLRAVRLTYGPGRPAFRDGTRADNPHGIRGDDVDALGRGLTTLGRLAGLSVTESELDAYRLNRLTPYLADCPGVEELDLSFCRLRSSGACSLARYVKTARNLRVINLRGNDIGPNGVESLAFAARWRRDDGGGGCPAIDLNLSMNSINDIGAKYLASALASGVQPFTKLRVRDCNITGIGGINIVQSLAFDQGLRALEIDNNPLTWEVAIGLHRVLKKNLNIVRLSIQNCNIPENMINFLTKVVIYNRYGKRSELKYTNVERLFDRGVEQEEEHSVREEVSLESHIEEEEVTDN